jgi:hypothetical protein
MITKTENSSFRDPSGFIFYRESAFEKKFQAFFKIIKSEQVGDSNRTLYLMKNKSHA